MNIDIMDFFYDKASKRIRKEVIASGLEHKDIYRHDRKQISWIINNNRTKNNRFLICDSVLESFDEDGSAFGLLHKLNFKNIKEILWGTDDEIEKYLPELFTLLWQEISSENNPYQIDRELYLCDYIPYAKYSTYWKILFSPDNNYPSLLYGIYEDDVINNIDSARDEALKFLYTKCKDNFAKIFNEFVNSATSFHKINNVIQRSFIEQSFIPMLLRFKSNEASLGLRVKELIFFDLSKCAELVVNTTNTHRSNKLFPLLINASSKYILELEKIQFLYFKELQKNI